MIKLPAVFSSGALLQGSTRFELRGTASPGSPVTASLTRRGTSSPRFETVADMDGRFTLALDAPPASFDVYDLAVADNDGEVSVENLLFGELWLASGQSNMEMTNIFMRDRAELYRRMAGKRLRVYAQDWIGGLALDGDFPFDEQSDLPGKWISADDGAALDGVSACASAAIVELYDRLNQNGAEVPVGFLNVSVGATAIETWLPRDAVMDGGAVERFIEKIGRLPTKEKFNTHGGINFTQPCALFNLKVAPLAGLRMRGAFWYQGESNVGSRESGEYYFAALRAYQSAYQKRFAPDGEVFQMLCSQIFPWLYSEDECTFGYLNQAFTDAADACPDKIGAATVYDLPPIWAFGLCNHPIHPSNKYEIGFRLGGLAHNRCHGGRGPRSAVTFKSVTRGRGRLTVRFNSGRFKLTCPERVIRGFYIAGKNGVYVEADAELRGGLLILSHPHVPRPVHAAYMASCMELSGRLYCGDLPVAPFMTDRENPVSIEPKPWTHTDRDSVFAVMKVDMSDFSKIDVFPRPTWLGGPGTQLCRDTVFSRTPGALRIIAGDDGRAEAYAPSYIANRLDMYNYTGMTFYVMGGKAAKIRVGFEYPPESGIGTLWFGAVAEGGSDPDGGGYKTEFSLPEKYCLRVIFEFDLSECGVKAVSMENIVLIPKQ